MFVPDAGRGSRRSFRWTAERTRGTGRPLNLFRRRRRPGQDEPIEVGGVVISSGVFSPDSNGTLIWEKDDAMFYLSAPLMKEDLIAMAERVRETEPSLTPLSGNTMILEGAAGGG